MGQNGGKDDDNTRRRRTSSLPSHEPIVQRNAKKQRRWKNCRSITVPTWKQLQLFFAQLLLWISSVFTVQSQKCVKNKNSYHAGRPVVGEQSSSSFVPNVINTNVLLNNDDPTHKELLLQRYGERIEKLSQQDKLSKNLYGCRIPKCCWSRTVFHDERHWRIRTIRRCSGLSWGHFAKRRRYICTEGLDQRKHQNWARIGSYNLCLQGNYGVEIRIMSVNKDNSHSWVRISHGPKQTGHGLEQHWAANFRSSARRICVMTECKWFCKPIKGKSKTTKTRFCQLIHKIFPYWREFGLMSNQENNRYPIIQCRRKLIHLLRHGSLPRKQWWSSSILENKRWS